MIRKKTTYASLVCSLALACAGGGSNIDITKPVTGEAATNAERAYRQGLQERASSNYIEATRYFEWVRNNFPYSQYSALAELALADMAYDRDDFADAAVKYREFVKSHPSHPKADFASFRVGLASYRDKPSDWFLLPPSYEKDQAPIRNALDALQKFVLSYPKSDYVSQARDLIADCRERLVAHERYVAGFYKKRNAWKGAAGRYLGIADTFGDLHQGQTRDEALWEAAQAFHNAQDLHNERVTLERLVQEGSSSNPRRREAQERLGRLPADAPASPAKPARTGELKSAPITPAETPGAPAERPVAAPGPGQPISEPPQIPPEGPTPARPTTQPPPDPPTPTSQPQAPPLGQPAR